MVASETRLVRNQLGIAIEVFAFGAVFMFGGLLFVYLTDTLFSSEINLFPSLKSEQGFTKYLNFADVFTPILLFFVVPAYLKCAAFKANPNIMQINFFCYFLPFLIACFFTRSSGLALFPFVMMIGIPLSWILTMVFFKCRNHLLNFENG